MRGRLPADAGQVQGQVGGQGRTFGETHLLQDVEGAGNRLGDGLPGLLQLQLLVLLGDEQVGEVQEMLQAQGLR